MSYCANIDRIFRIILMEGRTYMFKNTLFLAVFAVTFSVQMSFAQKWGKTTKEEREMTVFAEDTEADAIVIFEKGDLAITPQFELEMNTYRRIKILSEEGKKEADVVISYWHEDKISRLKAQTILPNGKKIKVKGKMIQERENGNRKEMVFTFPAVEVGAIIEYKYELWSKYLGYLEPWAFQNDIYTLKSECSLILPLGFLYNCFYNNPENIIIEPVHHKMMGLKSRYGHAPHQFAWSLENLPAVKKEPYMKNVRDYFTTIYFQIVSYKDTYTYVEFAKTWDDLAERVSKNYKSCVDQGKDLEDVAVNLTQDCSTRWERIKAVYNYITTNTETAPPRGLLNDDFKKPKDVIEDKDGSCVEKNLLLINLLNKLGYQAKPVLISTRNHGRVQTDWIQLQQFNHMIVLLENGSQKLFMDTGDKYCPFGQLPANDINDFGLLVDDKKGVVIPVPVPKSINMERVESKAKLTEDGQLQCQTLIRFEGYRAMSERADCAEKGQETYMDDMIQDKFGNATIDTFNVINHDNFDIPFVVDVTFTVDAFAQTVGDMVYLNPCLFHRVESNPFKKEERKYPIDYRYMKMFSEKVDIDIPNQYEMVENVENTGFSVANLSYQTASDTATDGISYERSLKITKVIFPPNYYSTLKNKYLDIVNLDKRQIVLKKKEL